MSESLALDLVLDLDFSSKSRKDLVSEIGFILTVARDNRNWCLVDDFLDKAFEYIRRK